MAFIGSRGAWFRLGKAAVSGMIRGPMWKFGPCLAMPVASEAGYLLACLQGSRLEPSTELAPAVAIPPRPIIGTFAHGKAVDITRQHVSRFKYRRPRRRRRPYRRKDEKTQPVPVCTMPTDSVHETAKDLKSLEKCLSIKQWGGLAAMVLLRGSAQAKARS